MISDRMAGAINKQINAELYSAYLYKSMAAFAADLGVPGVSNWMNIQALEESTHAERFIQYLLRVGARVVYATIEAPPADFGSVQGIFEQTLEHERLVTSLINELVNTARAENDHATEIMLQWFVSEQVEEEENAMDILAQVKLAGDQGLFLIDKDLAARVFTPPAAEA